MTENDAKDLTHHYNRWPLPMSEEMYDLCKRVLKSQEERQDEDIEAWARRLADNICRLRD